MKNNFKAIMLIVFSLFWLTTLSWSSDNKGESVVQGSKLLEAIESQNIERVQNILNSGFDSNKRSQGEDLSYLTSAVIKGNIDIVIELLNHGAEVNPRCKPNIICKPIILAAENGDIEILNLLIKHGADVNAVGPYNYPVLKYAIDKNQHKSIKVLLENGANINQRDQFSISNFELAISHSEFSIIKLMMKYNPDINAEKFSEKFTPLMMAAKTGRLNVVKYLIENGANPNIRTASGHTALDYAIHNKKNEIIAYLKASM